MTLTALMPTLRASLPDPIDATCWPVHTEPTVSDVRVSAVSTSRLDGVPTLLGGTVNEPEVSR